MIKFPLTAKFNEAGKRSHRTVVGLIEKPAGKGTTEQTIMLLADTSYGGSSREIILDHSIDEVVSLIEEMSESNAELDFSKYCQKPPAPLSEQKPQNGIMGLLRKLNPL